MGTRGRISGSARMRLAWCIAAGCFIAAALFIAVPALYRSLGLPWLWGRRIDASSAVSESCPSDSMRGDGGGLLDAHAVRIERFPSPRLQSVCSSDSSVVKQARELFENATFTYWGGYGAYVESMRDVVGCHETSLTLLDAEGCSIIEVCHADRWYVLLDGVAYSMDDAAALDDAVEGWIGDACEEMSCVGGGPWCSTPASGRRWYSEDEYH